MFTTLNHYTISDPRDTLTPNSFEIHLTIAVPYAHNIFKGHFSLNISTKILRENFQNGKIIVSAQSFIVKSMAIFTFTERLLKQVMYKSGTVDFKLFSEYLI